MKIVFLVRDLCHMGGVVTATQNMASALVRHHEVEIVALRKVRDESYFPLDERVKVRALTDLREHSHRYDGDDPLAHEFPIRYPYAANEKTPVVSRLAEKRLLDFFAETDADAVISSNPRITTMLAEAPGSFLRIAQEHSMPRIYAENVRKPLFEAYRKLDAITVLSPEEKAGLSKVVPYVRDRISVLPNCVPDPGGPLSDGASKVVVTAGVLKKHKNFHGLVDAFETVVERHPDWRLRIYGDGSDRGALQRRIHDKNLYNHVQLMGPAFPVTAEFGKGAIFVLPSLREPFGLVTVEAMTRGLPVVSMDCDHGPRNILTPGTDGILVPNGDNAAMAEAIIELIEDDDRRKAMGEAAVRGAERFSEEASAERFGAILEHAALRRRLPGTADAEVLSGGDVRVTLAGAGADVLTEGLELVCRDVRGRQEPVRLPVVAGAALIPRRGTLGEGRWELGVASAKGPEKRLSVEHVDVTRLVSRRDTSAAPAGGGLDVLLPHKDELGRLKVRSGVRERHAEVLSVTVDEHAVVVEAEFWGERTLGAAALLEGVNRTDSERTLTVPLTVDEDGIRFRFELPVDTLVAAHEGDEEIWDFQLRTGDGGTARLAMLATDILEPYQVFKYPRPVRANPRARAAAEPQRRPLLGALRKRPEPQPARTEVRPYFTVGAQFAVKTVTV
ncbi:glycosyltransferase [Streptomyces sp. NPDC127068]|uniref:glycosyltransferase n=1 Tax=Streptomyces sp. NPDC127068 TaxID=3347127 RepID=UPI00364A00DD